MNSRDVHMDIHTKALTSRASRIGMPSRSGHASFDRTLRPLEYQHISRQPLYYNFLFLWKERPPCHFLYANLSVTPYPSRLQLLARRLRAINLAIHNSAGSDFKRVLSGRCHYPQRLVITTNALYHGTGATHNVPHSM